MHRSLHTNLVRQLKGLKLGNLFLTNEETFSCKPCGIHQPMDEMTGAKIEMVLKG